MRSGNAAASSAKALRMQDKDQEAARWSLHSWWLTDNAAARRWRVVYSFNEVFAVVLLDLSQDNEQLMWCGRETISVRVCRFGSSHTLEQDETILSDSPPPSEELLICTLALLLLCRCHNQSKQDQSISLWGSVSCLRWQLCGDQTRVLFWLRFRKQFWIKTWRVCFMLSASVT